MRSVLQIVIVLLVIVASIFGLTFVNQYKVNTGEEDPNKVDKGPPPGNETHLIFPVKTVEWDPETAGEREMNKEGYWDLWFENRKDYPVVLGLHAKNCKCTKLQVCAFTPNEAKQHRQRRLAEVALPILRMHGGAADWATQAATELYLTQGTPGSKLDWHPFDEGTVITVPPQYAGWVRLNWDNSKKEGAERLLAEIWTQRVGGGPRSGDRLQLPIKFVSSIRIHQPTPRLDDLYPEKTGEIMFVCWSATRAAFSLNAHEKNNDPCFICSWTPLDDQQCAQLSETLKARVWCGYQVKVQVHERLANKGQLDLGPFLRQIILDSDVGVEPNIAYISGVVRGDVAIGTPEDKDRIDLRSFRSDRGTSKTVTLWTDQAGLELDCNDLKVEPGELGYLKGHIELKKKAPAGPGGSGSRWELSVKVPPDRVSGKLPESSAIFIKIQGTGRQIRVPIAGMAYRL